MHPSQTPAASPTIGKTLEPTDDTRRRATELNARRLRHGCLPLVPDGNLGMLASQHARYVADTGTLTHLSSEGQDPGARVRDSGIEARGVGETVARGREARRWSSEVGDPASDCDVTRIGVGYGEGRCTVIAPVVGCLVSAGRIRVEIYTAR
ncbi:hypothetical protein GCM10022235_85600 [Kribbella ginsengisoli]|uniref:SCP domain-containing protein n=1 Tax=Kribbella ginsengisoli TaxID=363865 RepID=A0ABP6Z9L4_9ACTN